MSLSPGCSLRACSSRKLITESTEIMRRFAKALRAASRRTFQTKWQWIAPWLVWRGGWKPIVSSCSGSEYLRASHFTMRFMSFTSGRCSGPRASTVGPTPFRATMRR